MIEEAEERPELEAILRRRVAEAGGIPFAEFMQMCLYHPQFGYYMGERQRIGRQGDFFTSSSVHAVYGRLIARQLRQMWEILGRNDFIIAEQGAGEGHLALDILDAAAEESPDFYACLRYRLIEIGPDSRRRQAELLARHSERVDWCDLEALAGMEGCFLSNELVDAFPVHLLERRDGEWREVFVVERESGLGEELRALSTPELAAHLEWLGYGPVEGNRGEVNLAAVQWMRKVADLLGRGFVLTIDYGYPAAELYAPFRRNGTLLCYFRHTAEDDPYRRFGLQDITSHVDFTALQKIGEAAGLQTLWFGEQYRFLLALGFVEALLELQAREPDERRARALRMTLKNLILPEGGMGETFKVLVQGKEVGSPELLCTRKVGELPLPF